MVMRIMRIANDLRGAQAEKRVAVIREIESEFEKISYKELSSLWMDALEKSIEYGRREILIDIYGFAPIFISRFGPDIAILLDDAIKIGGGSTWP